jgi:hypothetical protein
MRLSLMPSLSTPPKCQNVTINNNYNNIPFSVINNGNPLLPIRTLVASSHYPILSNSTPISRPPTDVVITRCQSSFSTPQNSQEDGDEEESLVQDLRVPTHWLLPSKAMEVVTHFLSFNFGDRIRIVNGFWIMYIWCCAGIAVAQGYPA